VAIARELSLSGGLRVVQLREILFGVWKLFHGRFDPLCQIVERGAGN
jgi:hypothetical protein